jgi:hypothetical protein
MAFSINDIRSNFNPARPTLFKVNVTFPNIGSVFSDLRDFQFLCRATSIPAMVVGQIEVPYFGRMMKVPGDRTFENWQVQVYNDENYKIRNAFETWNSYMNSLRSNVSSFQRPVESKGVVEITQYGKTGDKIRQYRLTGAFPIVVSEMELSWEAQNQIQTFNVQFAYDEFVPFGTAGASQVRTDTPAPPAS